MSELLEAGKLNGQATRLGEIVSWTTENKYELERMTGDEVVEALLTELRRLNAIDAKRIASMN